MIQKPDYTMTEAKFAELEKKLNSLLQARPKAAADVSRLAEFGDFSENVEYQLAKGRLRGINAKILETQHFLKNAEVIRPNKNKTVVQVGHIVTIETDGKTRTYQILGSSEADPNKNIISQNSPLGMALLGKKIGETATLELKDKKIEYKIIAIK